MSVKGGRKEKRKRYTILANGDRRCFLISLSAVLDIDQLFVANIPCLND
jgi:hypothetical protein